MMDNKPILSISLLCCGRYDDTVRCLNSLDHIRKAIPCELVIVDTGCDKKTRDFIEKKADKIIEFEWCKDFAKARNVGVDACSGQWFMFIDDDEYFSNTNDLEEFFKCGEYNNCTAAMITLRNYEDAEHKEWHDVEIKRLFKLEPEVRFVGKIHEYMQGLNGKTALIHTALEHTGYIFLTKEAQIEHSKRNIPPLIESIEEDPKNMVWRIQLAQEYYALEDWDKLISVCFDGIDVVAGCDNKPYTSLGCFYTGAIYAFNMLGQYQKAADVISIALDDNRINDYTRLCLAHGGALAYFGLADYENVIAMGDFYMDLYDIYANDSVKFVNESTLVAGNNISDYERNRVLSAYIEAGVKLRQVECLLKAFPRMDFAKENVWISRDFIDAIVDALATFEYQDWFADIFEAIAIHDRFAELLIVMTEYVEFTVGPAGVARMNRVISDVIARGNLNWPRLEALHKKWNS